jgi:hypothetical protein
VLRSHIKGSADVERIAARLSLRQVRPRELLGLVNTLHKSGLLADQLQGQQGLLGRIAHESVVRSQDIPLRSAPFVHGAQQVLPQTHITLISSYHCSRYNTQTKRLTSDMFVSVINSAVQRAQQV